MGFLPQAKEILFKLDGLVWWKMGRYLRGLDLMEKSTAMDKVNSRETLLVPACSTLIYEVEMLDFTKEKGLWDVNSHDRLEATRKFKESGNDLFKIGKYQRAAKKL